MPIIKKIGCIGGGVAIGLLAERVFKPESTFGKAAVNGTASATGAFGLSAAFDKNSKLLNTLTAGSIGVAVGSRDKLAEWGDWLTEKISGKSAGSNPKIGDKRADGKVWNGSAWVSVYDTTAEQTGEFRANPTPTPTPGPTIITVQAPKTEKKSTFETIFGGLTDVAGKVLPSLLEGALGSGASGQMVRAF